MSIPFTFIHQRPDWPSFRWDREALSALLAATRYRQGHLVGRIEAMGISLRDEALLQTLTEEVVSSSAIEGERLDRETVRSSAARRLGLALAGLRASDRRVDGVVEVSLEATASYASALTQDRLFAWHAALSPTGRSRLSKLIVGAWRKDDKGSMQVISGPIGKERVHFQAPGADRLAWEMEAFLDWHERKDDTDPVLRAALAHLWFVTIHPFEDGNGRIARAIADLNLARSESSAQRFYSMSAQIQEDRADYYEALEAAQRGELEVTDWLLFFLGCLGRAFDRAEKTLSVVLRKAAFWERHAAVSFNQRQRKILGRWLEGLEGKMSSSKWAKLGDCSQDTAFRDIDELLKRGILVKEPGGGRSTRYALVD